VSASFYSPEFFTAIDDGSLRSARVIVPGLVRQLHPSSAVDIGCGLGNFLRVFIENGVHDVLGVDGAHVPRHLLKIPADRFVTCDLEQSWNLGRRFDIAVCLEVAEHLELRNADAFIANLVSLAPVLLFSAAIPYQGGENHVNCQWPEYWQNLFGSHSYEMVDILRSGLMTNDEVEWWYAQNAFIVAHRTVVDRHPEWAPHVHRPARRLVHPKLYMHNSELAGINATSPSRSAGREPA